MLSVKKYRITSYNVCYTKLLRIDQFVLPSELSKKSLLCGVTSLFSDPIDIVSATGYKGFKEFLKLGENLPIRIFQVVPGGLPA